MSESGPPWPGRGCADGAARANFAEAPASGATLVRLSPDVEPLCDRIWYDHPGVISEPVPQHVLVSRVGLEEAVASFAVGFSCDDHGSYRGLGVLSAQDSETRRTRILDGKSPTS